MQDTDQEVAPQKKNKNKKSPARIKLRGICSTHRYWNDFLSFYFETPLSPILTKKKWDIRGRKKKHDQQMIITWTNL